VSQGEVFWRELQQLSKETDEGEIGLAALSRGTHGDPQGVAVWAEDRVAAGGGLQPHG